jgi:hypothetical protein
MVSIPRYTPVVGLATSKHNDNKKSKEPSHLGAHKRKIINESDTVAIGSQVSNGIEVVKACSHGMPVGVLTVMAEEKVNCIVFEMVRKSIVFHTLEPEADFALG